MGRFRKRWIQDYLLTLGAEKFATKRQQEVLQPGQVVLLREESGIGKPEWKLARVVEVARGRDGEQRRVKVFLPGSGELSRHISRISLLEAAPMKSDQRSKPERKRQAPKGRREAEGSVRAKDGETEDRKDDRRSESD